MRARSRRRPYGWLRLMMMTRLPIALLCACVGSAVVAAGASAASKVVKIGVVLPLTGGSATVGQAAEQGAQLAVQQANGGKLVPGVTFRLVANSDTGTAGTPNGASGEAGIKGLIGNGQVAGAVAPFDTATALGELPLANRAPLATVSPTATDTCLTIGGALGCTGSAAELSAVQPTGHATFFRVAPADALQGAALADFLFNDRGYRRAYVIDDTSAAGSAQAATFESEFVRESGTVVGHASVAPGAVGFTLQLVTAAQQRADVIVYTGASESEGVALRRSMVEEPFSAGLPLAATSGMHTASFLQAVGGIIGSQVWAVAPEPELAELPSAASFARNYQAKFGTPTTDAARGYDSAEALLRAVKAAIADGATPPASAAAPASAFRTAVIAALGRTAFTGADGPIAFAQDGDLQQGPVEVDGLTPVFGQPGSSSWTPGAVVQVKAPSPVAALTPSALDFGLLANGSSSELSLTLSNTGFAPFGVRSVSVSGSAFKLASTTCASASVEPSAQCTITIRFAPSAAGKATGSVSVLDTTGAPLQTATLSGIAVKPTVLPAAVYVGNAANSSVRSFTLPLAGNRAPATTLTGPDTQLNGTTAVALDKFGEVYVANSNAQSVTVYRGDASGDTKPMAALSGPDTGIAEPTAIALDAESRLYVANAAAGTVTVYAPGASGDAAPIRTITGITGPSGLVVDGAGNLWVASSPTNSLERFGPADTKPAETISGSATQLDGPQSLALDAAGDVLVADEYSSAITAYASTDNGDLGPAYSIAGSATGLNFPVGLDVDGNGNLYVSNFFGNSITVYSSTARGNVAPTAALSGTATGLAAPEHLAVSPPLTILTHRLPAGRANHRYRTRLIAAFGIAPSHWRIRSGQLPRGLRLNPRTGTLAGIPHQAGRFQFRVKVSDRSRPADSAIRSLTLTIHAAKPHTRRHRH
jgi:branched-chain amino acid transport system substrate-binding protein